MRRPGLDAVRAVAALLVVVSHLEIPHLSEAGTTGVTIFFVLSGYLITGILVKERRRTGTIHLGAFYLRRARRLLPALVPNILVVVALLEVVTHQHAALWPILGAFTYTFNWLAILFHGYGPADPFGYFWSLSVEEHFYLVWPVLLLGLSRWLSVRRLLLVTLGLLTISLAWRLTFWDAWLNRVYMGSDTEAYSLLAGCALALAEESGLNWRPSWWAVMPAVAAVAASCYLVQPTHVFELVQPTVVAGSVILVARARAAAAAPRALVEIGLQSYGLYLWHVPLLFLAYQLTLPRVVAAAAGLIVTGVLVTLSYRFVEQPFLRWRSPSAPAIKPVPLAA
ncbi:MAG TPA: acyltransferase [Chloroflexota bacterium]